MTTIPGSYLEDQFTRLITDQVNDPIYITSWETTTATGSWTNAAAPVGNWTVAPAASTSWIYKDA